MASLAEFWEHKVHFSESSAHEVHQLESLAREVHLEESLARKVLLEEDGQVAWVQAEASAWRCLLKPLKRQLEWLLLTLTLRRMLMMMASPRPRPESPSESTPLDRIWPRALLFDQSWWLCRPIYRRTLGDRCEGYISLRLMTDMPLSWIGSSRGGESECISQSLRGDQTLHPSVEW